jgi:mannose-6-phosphate isomerase-like protein (cupin superfamily)
VPVFPPGRWINPSDRPDWCAVAGAGRFAVPVDGGRFDRHHHDDDEIWFISSGRARIYVDDSLHYVREGDIVLTRAGDTHDVVEVYETLRGFFVETGPRAGHLYRDAADAAGHDVPFRPLPEDFPCESR